MEDGDVEGGVVVDEWQWQRKRWEGERGIEWQRQEGRKEWKMRVRDGVEDDADRVEEW